MTEFEQQVADAMCVNRYDGQPCRSCEFLAPRVAAAIHAAAVRGCNLGVMEPNLPNGLKAAHQVALAMLKEGIWTQ